MQSKSFFQALRPFSLTVGIASCGLGWAYAEVQGDVSLPLALCVVIAGVLLQAGANLINDYADLERVSSAAHRQRIRAHARAGAAAIGVASLFGVGVVVLRGWPMLLLGCLGIVGAWGYAAEPLNLKSRGLGLPAVFLLTGILMVVGSYYAISGDFSRELLFLSVPFSCFTCVLLLANELRDYEEDCRDGHSTFTVRFSYSRGAALYAGLILVILLFTLSFAANYRAPAFLVPAASLVLLARPLTRLKHGAPVRVPLARETGRCYFVYAACFIAAVRMSLV